MSDVNVADFRTEETFARHLDAVDPLAEARSLFHIPKTPAGREVIYLCGNSLGLQPRATADLIRQELDDWARLGVEGHFHGAMPWFSAHEHFREIGARLVGGVPGEVVMMNSLTVNLHLMMVSFYRPTHERHRILIEAPAFPSDTFAVTTHVRSRGLDPAQSVLTIAPRVGEQTIRMNELEELIDREGDSIALILLGGVNFFTGQVFDFERITQAGHRRGCVVGFDLAHAAGNVPLRLHDWNVDFACWCSYKYLNSGPGAVAGCFVHERHGCDRSLPRYAGWWGNDPTTRFRMHLEPEFIAREGADGWQISNPPILALTPLRASLEIFDRYGMEALRAKSRLLTGYLFYLLREWSPQWCEVITPSNPGERGCQLSLLVHDRPRERFKALESLGVVADFREPNVIRVAPTPLYNTFMDVWLFARGLAQLSA